MPRRLVLAGILVVLLVSLVGCGGSGTKVGLPNGVEQPGSKTPAQAASLMLDSWAQQEAIPYRDPRYEVLSTDGTFARVRITTELRESAVQEWLSKQAIVECRSINSQWQCVGAIDFSEAESASVGVQPDSVAPAVTAPTSVPLATAVQPTTAPTATAEPTKAPTPAVAVGVFDWYFDDSGNGWNTGWLRLYLVNVSSKVVTAGELTIYDGIVKTAEGRDYPVDLVIRSSVVTQRKSFYNTPIGLADNTVLLPGIPYEPIPPRAREFRYRFMFKFAQGTTPTKLVLVTSDEDQVELDIQNAVGGLPPFRPSSSAPLSALAQQMNEAEGPVKFQLGKCVYEEGRGYGLAYTLINPDQFDEVRYGIPHDSYIAYLANGKMMGWPYVTDFATVVGPAQTVNGVETFHIGIGAGWGPTTGLSRPLYLFEIAEDDEVRAYELDCPLP